MSKRRFAPEGHLAIARKAYGGYYDPPTPVSHEMRDGVAVVAITGPLMHHKGWFESYDAIKERVSLALAGRPKAVVLSIDSPGGVVSGCMETARELRAMAAAAKVPLLAHVEGTACSAAYAIASAAERIALPETGLVGSIGVITAMYDHSAADARYGLRVEMIASGERKADGCPSVPITPEAMAAEQTIVDTLAGVFFELVAEHRGTNAEAVRGLEAGVMLGRAAITAGLADEVASLDEMIAAASAPRGRQATSARTAPRAAREASAMDGTKLRELLGLAPEATDEDVMAAIELLVESSKEPTTEETTETTEASARRGGGGSKLEKKLLLSRLDRLEAKDADRDAQAIVSMVDADVAAGKIPTAERADYLELAQTNRPLYDRLVKNMRAVPTGRIANPVEGRRAEKVPHAELGLGELTEVEAAKVQAMKAAKVSADGIKRAIERARAA